MTKYIILCLVALGLTTGLFAQKLPSEQVEVLKKFEASLAQSQKLTTTPLLPAIEEVSGNLMYNIPTRLLTLEYEPPKLKPVALKRDKPEPTYKFYSKLGYGLPNMPFVNLHYASGATKTLAYGFNAYHNSANNSARQENQRFSETAVNANVTSFGETFAINGNLGYNHDVVHFYGYDNPSDTVILFEADSVRQRFSTIYGGVSLFNNKKTNGDINYDIGVDFHNISDAYEANELGVDIHADFTKWFNDIHAFKLTVGNDFTRFNNDSIRPNNNVVYIRPNFTFHGGIFMLKVGANMAYADTTFYVFPDIEAQVNIVGDKFAILAGATGDLQKNTFLSITDYNPFIQNQLELRNTRESYYYGGLRGNFNGFSFEGLVGYKQYKNLGLYLNDTTDYSRFNVLYDDVNSINIHGSVTFSAIKNLELNATIDANTFTPNSLEAAWHLPNFEMNINAKYRLLDDKLTLKAALYNAGGISYIDEAGATLNTGALLDLSLGAEYQVTDKFGVFLDLNNVTNQKFQRWYKYPNIGFNMMAGITLKF
jgi:hypothetical protein